MNPQSPSPPQTTAPARFWERDGFLGLVLVAAIVAAYWPVGRAGFIWDDGLYITTDRLLTAPDGLRLIWFSFQSPSQYFPLVYTVFRFEHALWGLHPAPYHWVNVLFHATDALLLWQLLRRLGLPGAWLAAAFFGLHPVQVESVAWVSELKNVLSLFFCLLSLHAWVNYLDQPPAGWRRWDWVSWACYLAALLSKTTACTLPAALLLLCWLKKQPVNRRRLLEMVPFLLVGVALGFVSVWWETNLGGTTGATFALGWGARLLIASHAIWFYFGKLLWPIHLLPVYPRWIINPADPLAYGWLAAGIVVVVALCFLARREVTAAALFYAAMLFPLLGFFMLYTFRYTFVADHWQYMSAIGPLALAAGGLATLYRGRPEWIKAAVCLPLLLLLGALTFRQTQIYASSETLWRATLEGNPQCTIAHVNLGLVLAQRGEVARSMDHYEKAIALDPGFAEAHEDLGVLQLRAGNTDQALEHFRCALALRPDYPENYGNLGNAWLQKGQPELAAKYLQWEIELAPGSASAHFNLGNVYQQQGLTHQAIAQYRQAANLDPANADAWNNLGGLLIAAGKFDEAASCLRQVVKLKPDSPASHLNLGTVLQKQGRDDMALAEYDRAAGLDPGLFQVWNNLAWVLANSRQKSLQNGPMAVAYAQRADQLSGGSNLTVLITLASAYARAGNPAQAAAATRRAADTAADQGNDTLARQLRQQMETFETNQTAN